MGPRPIGVTVRVAAEGDRRPPVAAPRILPAGWLGEGTAAQREMLLGPFLTRAGVLRLPEAATWMARSRHQLGSMCTLAVAPREKELELLSGQRRLRRVRGLDAAWPHRR